MLPILLSLGPVKIYTASVVAILAWCTASFLFWKNMRRIGIMEERVFDLMFLVTIWWAVGSRLGYVFLFWPDFAANPMKIFTPWIAPGFWIYGGLIAGISCMILYAKRLKIRISDILDSFSYAFISAVMVISVGSLLDGSQIGNISTALWAIPFAGARRHPATLYEVFGLIIITVIISIIERRYHKHGIKPGGMIGVWAFFLYSIITFLVEYGKESRVYLQSLSVNQWILVFLLAETLGILYVKGGGKEAMSRIVTNIRGGAYATFTSIRSRRTQRTSAKTTK